MYSGLWPYLQASCASIVLLALVLHAITQYQLLSYGSTHLQPMTTNTVNTMTLKSTLETPPSPQDSMQLFNQCHCPIETPKNRPSKRQSIPYVQSVTLFTYAQLPSQIRTHGIIISPTMTAITYYSSNRLLITVRGLVTSDLKHIFTTITELSTARLFCLIDPIPERLSIAVQCFHSLV
jgi:hypothetical protein